MIGFTPEEKLVVLLYSPGTRPGLIAELTAIKQQLTPRQTKPQRLADSVLSKLEQITDEEFESLDFFPDASG